MSSRFPYLPIRLRVRDREFEVEALLDTGFDGHVAVPLYLLANGQRPDGHLSWRLADGSPVLAAFYLGNISIGAVGPFPVAVTTLGDEALIGQRVASHVTITLDHGQRVIVEP